MGRMLLQAPYRVNHPLSADETKVFLNTRPGSSCGILVGDAGLEPATFRV